MDIALPVQNYAISSQKQWAAACSVGYHEPYPYLQINSQKGATSTVFAACAAILFVGVFALARYIKRSRAKKQYIRLDDDEVSPCLVTTWFGIMTDIRTTHTGPRRRPACCAHD